MYVCGFDTSNIHQYIFEYTCIFMYVAAVVIHTEGAPLLLPVSIPRSHQVQSSLWGGDSDWSWIGLYRSVLKKVDTAACIDTGLNTEQMKAPDTGSDT